MRRKMMSLLFAAVVLAALAACGGGSGSTATSPPPPGPQPMVTSIEFLDANPDCGATLHGDEAIVRAQFRVVSAESEETYIEVRPIGNLRTWGSQGGSRIPPYASMSTTVQVVGSRGTATQLEINLRSTTTSRVFKTEIADCTLTWVP